MRFRKLRDRETRPTIASVREEREKRKLSISRRATLAVVILLSLVVCAYWVWSAQWVTTRGRVVALSVAVSSAKTGRIAEILVHEGEQVSAGQIVARLDGAEHTALRKEALAKVEEIQIQLASRREMGVDPRYRERIIDVETELSNADANATKLRTKLRALEQNLQQANQKKDRIERLFSLQAITRPDLEEALAEHRSLGSELSVMQTELLAAQERSLHLNEKLALERANLEREQRAHSSRVNELEQQVFQARERVAAIEADFELGKILAPRDGVVTWIYAESGEIVSHKDTLLSVVDESQRWIEAYVEADDLPYIQSGQKATIGFSGHFSGSFNGQVVEIGSRYEGLATKPKVGPDQVRTPLRLGSVVHPVRIKLIEPLPSRVRSEMVASVRIRK